MNRMRLDFGYTGSVEESEIPTLENQTGLSQLRGLQVSIVGETRAGRPKVGVRDQRKALYQRLSHNAIQRRLPVIASPCLPFQLALSVSRLSGICTQHLAPSSDRHQ
jgi:hypothetical protein